jgi:sulfonate transport system permease protein
MLVSLLARPPRWARWITPLIILLAWQLASSGRLFDPHFVPSPSTILSTGWHLSRDGQLGSALLVSLRRVVIGSAIGIALAILFALPAGLSSWGDALLDPPMQMVKAIPLYGIVPLFIVWFGIGELPKVLLIAIGVLVPLYLSASAALRSVPSDLTEVARTLRLSRWERMRHLVLPAALPGVLVGLRLSLTVAWLVLIVSETINASSGIGYMIVQAETFLQTNVMIVGLLTYALLGLLTDYLVRRLERRALRWQREASR